MWFYVVFTAAWVTLAYGLMELMYQYNYWCQMIPYENGDVEVQCYYIP